MFKNIRNMTGMNRKDFARYISIPLETIEDWEFNRRELPENTVRVLAYYVYFKNQFSFLRSDLNTRDVRIIETDGRKIVVINNKSFKGLNKKDWKDVELYLTQYVGKSYKIADSAEIIYIDKDFPDKFANSKERIGLKGANRKAKANISQAIPELIQIASNPDWCENRELKHKLNAKYGWYSYMVRFALPVYSESSGEVIRYNFFSAKMLVRHANNKKKYLYDIIAIKKENEKPA